MLAFDLSGGCHPSPRRVPRAAARRGVLRSLGWLGAALGIVGCATSDPPAGDVPSVYRNHCLACHGEAGDGRGPAAGNVRPAPRDFADAAWQARTSDAQLRAVIRDGGSPHGMSPHMPGYAHLSSADLDRLVVWIRGRAR
jgi:mono/diheme cytochrome c family protein